MKTILILNIIGIIFFAGNSLKVQDSDSIPAPPCKQVEVVTDTIKRKVLSDFIKESDFNRRFVNNKGIVQLNIYKDTEGRTRWLLIPHIDDRYKDNPPLKFDAFHGDIILGYDADSEGRELKNPYPGSYNRCLEDIIGDRVYIRPEKKGRWTNYVLPWGRKMNVGAQREETGSGGAVIIIFNEDGTYRKIIPG